LSHTHWNLLPPASQLPKIAGVHPLVVQLLHNRGVKDTQQIELFLSNDARAEFDPFLIPDMSQAVLRTHQALMSAEKIVVYGDFDADGITATAILVQALAALGANVIPYIPNRASEGYGLSNAALEKLHEQGVSLVITCDTGVTATAEVERAKKLKMDIVITDHHVPVGALPQAKAVVNPKRSDSKYPFTDLAGVGVAYKFLQALITDKGREDIIKRSLDLVAIGTVADMVTLVSENRYWVKKGLELINETKRPGIQELMRCGNLKPGQLNAQSISWTIGPRVNAAGRIDNAATSYLLLTTEDLHEARSLAEELERKNGERVRQTNELLSKARDGILAGDTTQAILMAGGDDFHTGVMGLVAGRLSDKFYRPVILFKIGQETSRGSGRSIREFDLIGALTQCQDLLQKFGGHTKAAGMNLATRDLPEFQRKISELARSKLEGLDLRPHVDIAAEVPLANFNRDLYQQIQNLAPFGMGNPDPLFLSRHVEVMDMKQMGNNNQHLRLKLKQGNTNWDAVGWEMGIYSGEITRFLDVVFNIEMNHWNGDAYLRLNLSDFSPLD
jgi:single-stranded-DNA-specific exonuclease